MRNWEEYRVKQEKTKSGYKARGNAAERNRLPMQDGAWSDETGV